MEEKGYNGWTNYETWCMALWIDNDRGRYNDSREMARRLAKPPQDTFAASRRTSAGVLADALKQWQSDQMPELEASVWSDLLSAAFSEIDWYEIAENYLEEVATDDASEA